MKEDAPDRSQTTKPSSLVAEAQLPGVSSTSLEQLYAQSKAARWYLSRSKLRGFAPAQRGKTAGQRKSACGSARGLFRRLAPRRSGPCHRVPRKLRSCVGAFLRRVSWLSPFRSCRDSAQQRNFPGGYASSRIPYLQSSMASKMATAANVPFSAISTAAAR